MTEGLDVEPNQGPVTIGIVVGEASGDILGAGLMAALKNFYPQATFVGIGGPRMLAQGFESMFPQDRLAVMGLIEPLKRLPELLSIRRRLIQYFCESRPIVVIGIDAPDFNLTLEQKVRAAGIKTVHYVSPSVWAWRQSRVKKIAKAVDLMLTLLPFEAQFYQKHQIPVEFVGHPLADDISFENPQAHALRALGLRDKQLNEPVIALLPGSRSMEVQRLGDVFIDAAQVLAKRYPKARFIVPSANAKRHRQLKEMLSERAQGLEIDLVEGQSQTVMQAADVVLMASGTTSLEALLLKRPMVIAYIVAPLTYQIVKRMVRVKFVGLPNLLAGREIVPEYIQAAATAEKLAEAVMSWLEKDPSEIERVLDEFESIHRVLRQNASSRAAFCIHNLIQGNA